MYQQQSDLTTQYQYNSESEKMSDRVSTDVLQECIDLQIKKSQDYQNPDSGVTQAMHYRRGIDSIHDVIQSKVYRAQSLIESGGQTNFESLEDSYKDLINYASFAVAWLRGGVPGQDAHNRDIFNRKVTAQATQTAPDVHS